LGSDILSQIEEVSIDLWRPYKNVVEQLIPNAQVVADRFHVMKQINEELDEQRKLKKRQASRQKRKRKKVRGIAHSKYPLLNKKEKLNESEKKKLNEVKDLSAQLIEMYQIKESIRDIFELKVR